MTATALVLPSPMEALLAPENNLVIIAREFPDTVTKALARVAAGPSFRDSADVDTMQPDPSALLEHVEDADARAFLEHDIPALIREFGSVLRRRHLHARLAVVRDDACRKLHADYVTVRALCTYAGPGTEWVANEDVVRENLARVDMDVEAANRSVLRRPDAVRRCRAGDVILLKGEAYPGNETSGAVHRSPPIKREGLSRLVLKIDERPCGC